AMVGRTAFIGDIWYSIAVSGFIYPIFGHWAWGPGGWLGNMTLHPLSTFTHGAVFRDFAGSTVVHTVGGFIALAGAMALGPRLGRKFKKDGGGPTPPHDLTWGAIGGVILWFGWYGFHPGSRRSASTCSRAGGSTTRSVRSRFTGSPASGGRSASACWPPGTTACRRRPASTPRPS